MKPFQRAKRTVRKLCDSILPPKLSPKILLYSLQRKFIEDDSRFKIAVTTRQWGKSLLTSGEAVHDCLTDPGTTWVCMSAGERQALEWKAKASEWWEAYRLVVKDVAEYRDGLAEGLLRSAEIQFDNGSRIIAIPANPGTARGYSANIILDEFAHHENPEATWAAMFPSTTNELAGTFLARWRVLVGGNPTEQIRRKLKLRVVSTFNGRNNKFYDLWEKAAQNGYSKHLVTIHDAVADGMPLDVDKLKSALDDPDVWAQEFECQPMDASSVLLPYDLIARCESVEATSSASPEFYSSRRCLFVGWDFARKRDLSVPWVAEKLGDVLHTREVVEFRGMSTPDQIAAMRPRIRMAQKVCLDYTGNGVGCGDYLAREFGEYNPARHRYGKIELCTFNNALKVELFSKLRMAFESGKVRVPIARAIREDLHSVSRVVTQNGTITYRAAHSEDGHADRCTALALAHRAAGEGRLWGNGRMPFSI